LDGKSVDSLTTGLCAFAAYVDKTGLDGKSNDPLVIN